MTELLYRDDAYLPEATGTVIRHAASGVTLDRTIFYARGGGQPGDCGWLRWNGGAMRVTDTVNGFGGPALLTDIGGALPPVGTEVRQILDWDRRYAHMRIHTALHLLSVVIPQPVTGGAITAEKGRLDFDMEGAVDKDAVADQLNALIRRNLPVSESWISDEDLAANPSMVKTMMVKPPMGTGRVRLVRIGDDAEQVDLQPCGGTHVRATGEIGRVSIGKVEKKGRQNRRVNVLLGAGE